MTHMAEQLRRGTRRLILALEGIERYFELTPGEDALIGRSPDARLFLWESSISRRHCLLRATSAGVEIEDLGSRNACFVNGQRVAGKAPLENGCGLQIGKLAFAVKLVGLEAPAPAICSSCGIAVDIAALTEGLCPLCVSLRFSEVNARAVAAVESMGLVVKCPIPGQRLAFQAADRRDGGLVEARFVDLTVRDRGILAPALARLRGLTALEHPGLVPLLEIREGADFLVLVFAQSEGTTLEDFVAQKRPFHPVDAIRIVRSCAEATAAAHAMGFTHGELSPGNVLVGPDGGARLTGFTVVQDILEAPGSGSGSRASRGLPRVLFLAPERLESTEEIDPRTDVFGLGALLVFALVGRPPWGDVNPGAYLCRQLSSTPPSLDLRGVPDALAPLIRTLLSRNMLDRPASVTDVIERLEAASIALIPRGRDGETRRG